MNYLKHMLLSFIGITLSLSINAYADENKDQVITYHRADIDGLSIFYREAGERNKPTVVLLHGFPSSSQMYKTLIPELADDYHVIAPDYPGFGQSEMPSQSEFDYSFENISLVMLHLFESMQLNKYALYMMDYGAPVGFRIATAAPEKVTALIVQNGNAYDEGLGAFWDPLKLYWQTASPEIRNQLSQFLTLEITRYQYTHGTENQSLINPDSWTLDQFYLDRAGNKDIQLDLFFDYQTNVALYPEWQQYLRDHQPPTLVAWGKNDEIFATKGALGFKRDLPDVELHLLDTGHFALETHLHTISRLMKKFLKKQIKNND